ncbi:unnamed protein product [Orchesella dallaii]|uniref:Protein-cysteine N-palmitoyltransferase HHAT n=1 Tax=Orchesella dallaii TaxID=48710 RepID=A0ABP1QY51_9HEXA
MEIRNNCPNESHLLRRKPDAGKNETEKADRHINKNLTTTVQEGENDTQRTLNLGILKDLFVSDLPVSIKNDTVILVLLTRILALVGWTGAVLYSTYHVFLACEKWLEWHGDPVMNPSVFSRLLNRGKDNTDYEWEMFSYIYVARLGFWYAVYAIMSRTVQIAFPKNWPFVSTGLSFIMFWELTGFLPTVFLLLQPVIYWILAQARSKLLLWVATILFIYHLNSPFIQVFTPTNTLSEYFYIITAAWNYARCISFCYDMWEKIGYEKEGLVCLQNGVRYCFYLPLAISGPLVTYESFEKNIILQDVEVLKQRNLASDITNLAKKMLRIGFIALLIELMLHFLYFRSLSMTTNSHRHLSLWAICGTVYWLGQFFALKYKVLYGVPTCVAEFDGMEMPPLPRCPSYLHRYSVLWRDFDRGLYRFLVNYIYLPTLKFIRDTDKSNVIPSDVKKLIASFMSFVYVYIWHSLSFDVFVWAALNFLGITIERIGSAIKREVDKRTPNGPNRQFLWDFAVEPFVTVPLAAMSILNSSIFCGSMESAISFSKVLWHKRQDSYVSCFLYCFTHTAVAYRIWKYRKAKKDA